MLSEKKFMMVLRRIIITGLLLLCMNVAHPVHGAELLTKFHPYIKVSEEYSDNLNLTPTNKKADFITTIQPGIKFSNMDAMAGIDFDYALGAVFYGRYDNLNYISHNASLNARYLTSQRINFYLQDSFIRSDNPREREYFTTTQNNQYVLAVNTERAVYWRNVFAPTIEYKFGAENTTGIKYRNNIFRMESATGQNSREDYINPFFSYWFNKQNAISLEYGITFGDFEINPDLVGHLVKANYTYRFSARSSVFAEYSYLKRSFASPSDADYDINSPSAGFKIAITPTLNASIQGGYYWMEPRNGASKSGFSYQGQLSSIDPRTTYIISLQGGYTEDYFTAENLGFNKYHRLTGSINHKLERRLSIGLLGSAERADFTASDRTDTIWGIGGQASYMPFKWLTFSLSLSRTDRQSNITTSEYAENSGLFSITAIY